MVKLRLFYGLVLLTISILAISCGSMVGEEIAAADDRDSLSVDEDGEIKHLEGDEGAQDEHVEGTEDEHMDEDDHGDSEQMAGDTHAEDEQMNDSMHAHADVPHEYAELENPLLSDDGVVQAGAETFATYCVACHGTEGKGDGPTAATLDPPPADLTDSMMMGSLNDAYLYWRIAEGGLGAPFNSAMPAWKGAFSEEQIWQLVTFLRTLPEHGGGHR